MTSYADTFAGLRLAAVEESVWYDNDDDDEEEAQLSSCEGFNNSDSAEAQLFPPGAMDFAMMNSHMQSAAAADSLYSQNNGNSTDNDNGEEALFLGWNVAARAPTQPEVNTWNINDNDGNRAQANAHPLLRHENEAEAKSQTYMPSLNPQHFHDAWLDDDEESQISQPPQVFEVIHLPQIDVYTNDVTAINSILGSISDPAIRAVLKSLVEDPVESACKQNTYDNYINQPDPSQHSWTPLMFSMMGCCTLGLICTAYRKIT